MTDNSTRGNAGEVKDLHDFWAPSLKWLAFANYVFILTQW